MICDVVGIQLEFMNGMLSVLLQDNMGTLPVYDRDTENKSSVVYSNNRK